MYAALGVTAVMVATGSSGGGGGLTPGLPPATVTLGRAGYIAKGIALGIVGVLFGWAAISYDPEKAGGLDTALRTLREQPGGPLLLTAVALGIACFGVYCFVWSRNAKH